MDRRALIDISRKNRVFVYAQEGLGIAMDRRPFGELQKTNGQLVTPVPDQVSTGWSYYFVASERSHSLDRVRKMRRWLKTICAVFGDSQ